MTSKELLCRKAAASGSVLLKNHNDLLPLKNGIKAALFGRTQLNIYRCGTGSGGFVSSENCLELNEIALREQDILFDKELLSMYESWGKQNPYDNGGGGWGKEPWHQKEMPIPKETVKSISERNDVAVIIIGRTAGEDKDNAERDGSYFLTEEEKELISAVTDCFENTVVAVNCGNLIDLTFMDEYPVSSVLYIWQGGMTAAEAFIDILKGSSFPGGKLPDTQLYSLKNHPALSDFGNTKNLVYKDDIYVGYRYFETFEPENVRYPFGFGLGYTEFEINYTASQDGGKINIEAVIENTGSFDGTEVIQVYYKAPCGSLGTPEKQLIAFEKTKVLKPGKKQKISLSFLINSMASFDDTGITGNKDCFVLQAGEYKIFVGTDVRSAGEVYSYEQQFLKVTEKLCSALEPLEPFERIVAKQADGKRVLSYGETHKKEKNIEIGFKGKTKEIKYEGDRNISLADVYYGKNSLEEFISQMDDEALAQMVCGEGMSSPKATPGAGGAIGGLTEKLSQFGIPVCCVTDGPSGIRLNKEDYATQIPCGTLLAAAFDTEMITELYAVIGEELRDYEVDSLLGPGINIHRNPLCGRNFEYFSEDPLLSGKTAAAASKGISRFGGFTTVKHFCCNNQETGRSEYNVSVSPRALREIYLKPFEIAVKEGENILIMTAYNRVNGFYCASNRDLTADILRREWNYQNFVMTDWWAKCNYDFGGNGDKEQLYAMVKAQNDIYMVCEDSQLKCQSILVGLKNGYITRAELQACVYNLCKWILRTNTFSRFLENGCNPKYPIGINDTDMKNINTIDVPLSDAVYEKELNKGLAVFVFNVMCDTDILAQNPVSVKIGNKTLVFSVCGTEGEFKEIKRCVNMESDGICKVSVSHTDAVKISKITIKQ